MRITIPEIILRRLLDDRKALDLAERITIKTLAEANGLNAYRVDGDCLTDEPEGTQPKPDSVAEPRRRRGKAKVPTAISADDAFDINTDGRTVVE